MISPVSPTEQCPHCGRYNNRGLTVDMVVVRGNKILLGKRGNPTEAYAGYWAIFGGYVEWGESVDDALARETKEESNLTVTSKKLIGVYSKPSRAPRHVVTVAYAIEVEGKPKAGDDIVEVKWYPLDDMPKELAFDHAEIIADYLATME